MATKNSSSEAEVENIGVFVRVRPFSQKEEAENHLLIHHKENLIALNKNNAKPKLFQFDQVFPEDSLQFALYQVIAAPIVEKTLQGYNGTIFAYGQTGTGKTYTMAGNYTEPGIIPNTFSHIFDHISRASGETSFVVTVSYLEIYNEEVRDLLSTDPNKNLTIRERPDVGVYVKNLSGFTVDSIESVIELFNRGNKIRVTRSTMMNNVSSRSHAMFTVTTESKYKSKTTVGKLNLVDLAGSERASRTQATGDRLREASSINLSLSILGNVISALVDGKSSHIPYRNSKLTRLLQDSLGGNSKTAMIATISPADRDYEETLCTLRYAARVRHIQNHTRVNIEPGGLIENFEQEIAELEEQIHRLSLQEQNRPVLKKRIRAQTAIKSEKIKKCEEELEKTEKEKNELMLKIATIQKRILVGGENLIEKAQLQASLIESSGVEIEILDKSHQQLEETLCKKGQERIEVEEKYSSLQEEDIGVTDKIRKVQNYLNEAKAIYADREHDYQRDMEALLDSNRLLLEETQLASLIMDNCVPEVYLRKIENNVFWNSETQEYQLRGIAYTGNHKKIRSSAHCNDTEPVKVKMKSVYFEYPKMKRAKNMYNIRLFSAVPYDYYY